MCRKLIRTVMLGVLVLLALSSGAHARDTSITPIEIKAKKPIIVLVSIIDDVAFTDADTDSLKRYLKYLLPRYEVVHISANTSVAFSPIAQPHQIQEARETLIEQIKTKIRDQKISHLVIMDHGSTSMDKEARTSFKFLGSFGKDGPNEKFREVFDPMVGKFLPNAFIMIESCSTVCDGIDDSEKRIGALLNYFQVQNGTVFAAYQQMLSMGYEIGFHFEQILGRMKSPPIIGAAVAIGLATQLNSLIGGSSFDLVEFFSFALGTSVLAPVTLNVYGYIKDKFKSVNWGYLYKYENKTLNEVYELNPYENKKSLYLNLKPKKIKPKIYSCALLFD